MGNPEETGIYETHRGQTATVGGDDVGGTAFARRRFLQAAAASTAAVWVAPALTTVTAAPAYAQASPVPEEPEVGGVVIEDPDDPQVAGVALVGDQRDLPRTGDDALRLLAAGAAAVAGGAAVVRATQAGDDDLDEDALPAG